MKKRVRLFAGLLAMVMLFSSIPGITAKADT